MKGSEKSRQSLLDAMMYDYADKNAKKWYSDHPLIPLYGHNAVPYYNEAYSKKVIRFSDDGKGSNIDNNPTISPYIVEGAKKCVIIYPGGGYFQRSDVSEGIDVAKEYNKHGISAFVVRYRVGNREVPEKGYNLDAILSDGQRAVQYVRYYADEFGIETNKIAVLGFSAGGHLAMMVSQNEHERNVVGDKIGEISNIPNATILCSALTTMNTGTIDYVLRILSGNDPALRVEISDKYSGQLHVTNYKVPAFAWYGEEDTTVIPEFNSIAYCDALKAADIYSELYSYKEIGHVAGIYAGSGNEAWPFRSVTFLNTVFD